MKSNEIKVVLSLAVLFALTIAVVSKAYGSDPQGWGLISEVALRESDSEWDSVIEIFVTSKESLDIGKAMVYHYIHYHPTPVPDNMRRLAYSFSTGTVVNPGDYLLLYFNSEKEDNRSENVKHFYSTYTYSASWGLSDSRGAFVLTSTSAVSWEDEWSDFVIWQRSDYQNEDDKFYLDETYSTATLREHWFPDPESGWENTDYIANVSLVDKRDGYTLQRENAPQTGGPVNTNTKYDWVNSPTTLGYGYFEAEAVEKTLQVSDTPFYPHEGDPDMATIGIRNSKDEIMRATVKIYDLSGYALRELIRYHQVPAETEMSFKWDGEDDSGDIVPMGIYVVHLTLEDASDGSRETEQASVVVGRRF